MSAPSFNEWVQQRGHAPNGKWVVLHRRTSRMLERYADSTIFSPKHYSALVEEHRQIVRSYALHEVLAEHRRPVELMSLVIDAFEAGRRAR